ncbi:MAG TPA: cyclic nucleotide-binding domain-containing protein [Polyangiaceae bacterium LLY-WYZ-15_(1-7)]|nr:cyclic nucleotide-binding domain-containing protein [Polyangiaceae bacterium LLY-WYZ-15_(1-7)]
MKPLRALVVDDSAYNRRTISDLLESLPDVEVVGKDADGDELRIAELGPGDVVGEISLVLRRPANATVRALHRTVALELTREEFQKAIKEHPTLLGELYEMATQREEETRTVVAQEALDVEDVVLL